MRYEKNSVGWYKELRAFFSDDGEYPIALDAFNFLAAWRRGETPQQAYEAFDAWATGGDR